MLSGQHRLKKDKDFKLVFGKGKTFSSEFLLLKFKKNDLDISRFGFIIGKKISKKSTVRNKIRRRLAETLRNRLAGIRAGFDIILVAKPKIIEKDYKDIDRELGKLLEEAKLTQ